jgi:hypothetical protein
MVTRQVQRQAKTRGAAERALAAALRDRGRADAGTEITPDTKLAVLAEKWFSELEGKSPSIVQAYPDRLDRQVLGGILRSQIRAGLSVPGPWSWHCASAQTSTGETAVVHPW